MKLNYKEYGEGKPLVILHGLFGSLDNWFSLAKAFTDHHHVYLIDQRNHAQSPHSDTHTYDEMADDLFEFFSAHGVKDAVLIGHSMGGKTAMKFAALHSELLEKLIIVDMGIKQYPVHHDLIIRSMQALDLDAMTSRKEAEAFLSHMLDEDADTIQFLLKNIYRQTKDDGSVGYAWRFNLPVLAQDIEEMGLPILSGSEVPTLFINGTKSKYIVDEDKSAILDLFPNAQFKALNTGHWVHAQDPEGFVNAVKAFID
ncbi:MAG: alpha/beta fold hydrolase [Flavobacteriales bacterium]|nr:alpha/beta fold hydrolase [Flavobacteriales bacterium]